MTPAASILDDPNHPDRHWLVVYGVHTKVSIDANSYSRLVRLADSINKSWADGFGRRPKIEWPEGNDEI